MKSSTFFSWLWQVKNKTVSHSGILCKSKGEKEGMMFALHSIAIIFHQKPEATTSTAKGGGSTFNGIYSPPPPPPAVKVFR